VAIVEQRALVGGVCINTGTIPSKTLREAALHLSGFHQRNIYGSAYSVKQDITMSDLLLRTDHVIRNEIDVTHHQLRRNGIKVLAASASFAGSHTIHLDFADGRGHRATSTDKVVVAVGTECTRAPDIPFDDQTIFTSDDILGLETLPRSLAIIGAGVIGLEYATIFATLGVRVTLIDKRDQLLDFVDGEITDALAYLMRQNRVALRLDEGVESVKRCDNDNGPRVRIDL
jgi:NAD(P) transhydrogenase